MQIMNRVELYSLLTISMTICLASIQSSSQEGEVDDDDDCASASGVDVLMVVINAAIIGYMTLLLVCGGATGFTTFRKSMLRRISRTPTRATEEDDLHEIEMTAPVVERLQRNSSLYIPGTEPDDAISTDVHSVESRPLPDVNNLEEVEVGSDGCARDDVGIDSDTPTSEGSSCNNEQHSPPRRASTVHVSDLGDVYFELSTGETVWIDPEPECDIQKVWDDKSNTWTVAV
jgi:hypothetical protein